MFRFSSPEYLYLLALVPILALIFWLSMRREKKLRRRLLDDGLSEQMIPGLSLRRRTVRFVFMEIAIAAIVLVLARPQYGVATRNEEARGVEIVFAVDVSNSMLAEDVDPNRLDRAKLFVQTILDRLSNDKIGLISFAGEAYPQMPITNDYSSARLFIDNLSTETVTLQGTNLAAAIKLANMSFSESKDVGKALVIITDGEDHEGQVEEALAEAKKENIRIYVLGIGTTQGAKIPSAGGFLKDPETGNDVVTVLNEAMCKNVAKEANGLYLHIDNTDDASQLLQKDLKSLKQASTTVEISEENDQFQAFALIALVFLLLEFFTIEKKHPIAAIKSLFGKRE